MKSLAIDEKIALLMFDLWLLKGLNCCAKHSNGSTFSLADCDCAAIHLAGQSYVVCVR